MNAEDDDKIDETPLWQQPRRQSERDGDPATFRELANVRHELIRHLQRIELQLHRMPGDELARRLAMIEMQIGRMPGEEMARKLEEMARKLMQIELEIRDMQASTRWLAYLGRAVLAALGSALVGGIYYLLRLPGITSGGVGQ